MSNPSPSGTTTLQSENNSPAKQFILIKAPNGTNLLLPYVPLNINKVNCVNKIEEENKGPECGTSPDVALPCKAYRKAGKKEKTEAASESNEANTFPCTSYSASVKHDSTSGDEELVCVDEIYGTEISESKSHVPDSLSLEEVIVDESEHIMVEGAGETDEVSVPHDQDYFIDTSCNTDERQTKVDQILRNYTRAKTLHRKQKTAIRNLQQKNRRLQQKIDKLRSIKQRLECK